MARGLFITLEGGEGTGKSTQAKLLADRISGRGQEVVATREPGGSPDGEAIRALLVSGEPGRWTADEEALLNYAARGAHLRTRIRPALERGAVVVCDRFMDSTRAYQGSAGGADPDLIGKLEKTIVGDSRPDVTLVLDADPMLGLQRAGERDSPGDNRFERKGSDFHHRLRDAFLAIANADPRRCFVIDASQPADRVAEQIWAVVAPRLPGP